MRYHRKMNQLSTLTPTTSRSDMASGRHQWQSPGLPGVDSSGHLRSQPVDTMLGDHCYGEINSGSNGDLKVSLHSEKTDQTLGYLVFPYQSLEAAVDAGDALLAALSANRMPYGFHTASANGSHASSAAE